MKLGVLGYMEKNGKVLMLFRNKKTNDMHEGLFVAPGGHIESGESPYEALVREIGEETNLSVLKASLKVVLTFPENGESPFGELWYGFVYHIDEWSGTVGDCDEGDLHWKDYNTLLSLPMWEGDRIFTPLVFTEGIYDVKLCYRGNVLESYSSVRIC